MKSKLLWLIMTAVAALTVSCGGEKKAEAVPTEGIKAEIVVQAEKEWVPYYEKAIERVKEKNPESTITIKEVSSFDHLNVLDATDTTNADIADVYAFPLDRLMNLSQKAALAEFDAKALADKVGGFDNFDSGLGGQLKVDGKYLGFPYNIETLIAFVNTANAKKANMDITKPIEMSSYPVNVIEIPAFDAWYGVSLTNSADIELLGQKDGKFFSDMTQDFSNLSADKQALIKGLYDYWKINDAAKTSLFDSDAGYGYSDEQFKTGNSGAIAIGGPWSTASLSKLAGDGKDLDVLPLGSITLNGKPLKHWKGGWALGINARNEKDAQKMALSEALIAELMNRDYAVDLFKYTGKIMENVPKDVYASSSLSDSDKKVVLAVIDSYKNSVSRPLFEEWGQVWDTWKNAILSWNSSKPKTVEDAYKQIKASFDSMMTNIGG